MSKHFSKIIILLSFLFTITVSAYGQVRVGLSSGLGLSSYTVSKPAPGAEFPNKAGFSIAVLAEYPFTERFSVRLLAGYAQLGGKNRPHNMPNLENKIYLDYLELSPYLIYNVIESNISAKIIAGFSYGHLVNAYVKTEGKKFQVKDAFNLSNVTSAFGLEMEMPVFQRTSIILDGIYSLGLTNIAKFDNGTTSKTRDIQISAGVLYNL